ncbi:MAG: CDP-diacylglycerol--serine O-phosphatidyltransferase [Balneolales bacterium]
MKYNIQKKKHNRQRNVRLRKKLKPRPIPRLVVPSFFTLMNLFCGFIAIIQIFEGKPVFGAWLIVFAGVFDLLDGVMARLANADSEFGIELDSLSDMVSFGAAPAFLIYAFSLNGLMLLGIIVCALIPLCGAVRLARFNVDTKVQENPSFFKGLPIPAQAIMIVSFYLTFNDNLDFFSRFEYGVNSIVIPMVVLLSFLMVSTVPFDKVPRFNKAYLQQYKWRVFLFLLYFFLIISLQEYGLLIAFSIFILKGLAMAAVLFWDDISNGDDNDEEAIGMVNEYKS